MQSVKLLRDREMEKYSPHSSMFEPTTYRISILGILDKKWSDYYGGMAIFFQSNV